MTKILDVGCGSNKTPGAIGLDNNPRTAADVIHDLGTVPYPFAENEFDEIISRHAVEHVPDVMTFVTELYRITKPGGRIKLVTPHYTNPDWANDPTHRNHFNSYSFNVFMPDRRVFDFAKALGAEVIIAGADPASLPALDKLAAETGVKVGLISRNPKGDMAALEGRGKSIGLSADIGAWMQDGVKPLDGLALVKDRLLAVDLRDRNTLGARGRDVTIGAGAAGMTALFNEMNRLALR